MSRPALRLVHGARFDVDAFAAALERWQAWARPERRTPTLEDPLLARLRAVTDQEARAGLAALDRDEAAKRGCRVADLPWNRRGAT